MSENLKESGKGQKYNKLYKDSENNPPLFHNRDHGVTCWVEEDKNGDNYLRLKLPLGIGSIPLFLNDSAYKCIQNDFNEMVNVHLKENQD
ncbi:hypothetical protein GLU60_02705 [Nanohaloarchaea archaeon H01]|nr:hypothetical protein [Nanohaloarchaea archaeon H01]